MLQTALRYPSRVSCRAGRFGKEEGPGGGGGSDGAPPPPTFPGRTGLQRQVVPKRQPRPWQVQAAPSRQGPGHDIRKARHRAPHHRRQRTMRRTGLLLPGRPGASTPAGPTPARREWQRSTKGRICVWKGTGLQSQSLRATFPDGPHAAAAPSTGRQRGSRTSRRTTEGREGVACGAIAAPAEGSSSGPMGNYGTVSRQTGHADPAKGSSSGPMGNPAGIVPECPKGLALALERRQ